MINPGQRVRLEDELIRFFQETHNASGSFHRPKDPITRYVSLPPRNQPDDDWTDKAGDLNVTELAEALLDGRVRVNG